MPTSTVMLTDEIMNYMYSREWISMCYGHNWVLEGLTGHSASCSVVSFLWNQSRSQWYPLPSGSNHTHTHSLSPLSLRLQFTQPLIFTVVPDRVSEEALVLTERDRYPIFRSQLRDRFSSCRYITPCLMKSQVMMWLVRLTRHTTT